MTTTRPATPLSAQPEEFRRAVAGLSAASARPEIRLGTLRPPQQLAPHTYAVGAEIGGAGGVDGDEPAEETTGRLILLHDPDGHEAWDGTLRLVAYVQAEVDPQLAADPLLPDVAWSWLTEALADSGAHHTALGGTVTATASVRFGDIVGPPRAQQVELRASWTVVVADDADVTGLLTAHADAFCGLLAAAAGLPPLGISALRPRHVG